MGKHQWLPNGNMLITESMAGRAFEIDNKGTMLWEYFNLVEPHLLGLLTEAQRLTPFFNKVFFDEKSSQCSIMQEKK